MGLIRYRFKIYVEDIFKRIVEELNVEKRRRGVLGMI